MTLPAAGTCDFQPFWANPQGVRFKFAETWYNLFLHTAGRVMTLPYECGTVNENLTLPAGAAVMWAIKNLDIYEDLWYFLEICAEFSA